MLAQAKRYVIVQRGQVALFVALQKRYATDPNREVIWDRRRGEDRRVASLPITVERRRDQRRMPVDDGILTTRGYFVSHAMRGRRRRMPQRRPAR